MHILANLNKFIIVCLSLAISNSKFTCLALTFFILDSVSILLVHPSPKWPILYRVGRIHSARSTYFPQCCHFSVLYAVFSILTTFTLHLPQNQCRASHWLAATLYTSSLMSTHSAWCHIACTQLTVYPIVFLIHHLATPSTLTIFLILLSLTALPVTHFVT